MVSASPPCAAPNSISAFVAPKTENQAPGGGLCRLRRISILRSTRQDAQINYLSTLTIFMKQTTYLATLPNCRFRRSGWRRYCDTTNNASGEAERSKLTLQLVDAVSVHPNQRVEELWRGVRFEHGERLARHTLAGQPGCAWV